MKLSLSSKTVRESQTQLAKANKRIRKLFPGESESRQPVHTVYGGAHLFKKDTIRKIGSVALQTLDLYAPDSVEFGKAMGIPGDPAFIGKIYERVKAKLLREPVEDFRIDFEDGYGFRSDEEEDLHARLTAEETVLGLNSQSLPSFFGIRIKPLNPENFSRSVRTLDIFLTTLCKNTKGKLPPRFVITLPKIEYPEQVSTLVQLLWKLESQLNLEKGILKLELMVETPQSILDHLGQAALPRLISLAQGRCVGAHFGAYDFTASCGITAAHQSLTHPACDFARQWMLVSLAGTGVALSDGATNIIPIGPNRPARKEGQDIELSGDQVRENKRVVLEAWKLNYRNIQHSLVNGFYQGWDLHPAQLPVRYAAVYAFFLSGFDATTLRLKAFLNKAAQATLHGDVFDDSATGQGLLNFFLRGIYSGAVSEEEARFTSGLTLEELRSRSFHKIIASRRKPTTA